MKDTIKEYFYEMIEEDISIEGAKENLEELIEEAIAELEVK